MRGRPRIWITLAVAGLSCATLWEEVRSHVRRTRWRNEEDARRTLLALAAAQKAVRAGDLDGNGAADYWTADVAGLAAFGVIGEDLARADLRPRSGVRPRPWKGYFYVALEVPDRRRFAYFALPADPSPHGRMMFIDEGGYPIHRHTPWTGGFRCPTEDDLRREWSRCWGG